MCGGGGGGGGGGVEVNPKEYGILLIFSLFYEYTPLQYVRIPVIYRVHQAEYVIHILVAVSQEYVNTYSTPRCMH